jgi:hypothetical protein
VDSLAKEGTIYESIPYLVELSSQFPVTGKNCTYVKGSIIMILVKDHVANIEVLARE